MLTNPFKVHEYVAHTTEVVSLAISPKTGQVLATGGEDCKVNIWDVKTAGNIRSLGSNKAGVESLCFDPDDTIVVSGSASGAMKVFDLNEGRLSRNLVGHKTNITSLQYHPISEYVVSGSKDCNVKVWDVRNKECLSTYTGHDKEVTCVRFSPDGRWVASSSKDGTVLIWDMVAGKHLQTLKVNPSYVTTFEFNPCEFLLAAVTNARAVKVWNLESMEVTFTVPPEQHAVKALSFSPTKPVLCTATKDAVKSWTWEAEEDVSGGAARTLTLSGLKQMGSEGVPMSALRISKSGNITGASFVSNFVSIYRTNLADLASSKAEASAERESKSVSTPEQSNAAENRLAARPPFALYGNPGSSPIDSDKNGIKRGSERGVVQSPSTRRVSSGEVERIRADRERFKGTGRERVVDRQQDWSAAEPKQSSPPQYDAQPTVSQMQAHKGYKSVSPDSHGRSSKAEPVDRQAKGSPPAYLFAPQDETAHGNDGQIDSISRIRGAIDQSAYYSDTKEADRDEGQTRVPSLSPVSRFTRQSAQDPREGHRVSSPIDLSEPTSRSPSSRRSTAAREDPYIAKAGQRPLSSDADLSSRQVGPGIAPLSMPKGDQRSETRENDTKEDAMGSVPVSSQDRMLTILDAAIRESRPFSSSLSKRLVDARVLRKFWNRGDLEDVMDHLETIKGAAKHDTLHLVVLADFFNHVELVGNGLSLDTCLRLLPLLEELISYAQKSRDLGSSGTLVPACGHIVNASLKAFNTLIDAFGDLIRDTCASHETSASAGVDLSREARFKKCKVCLDIIRSVRKRIPLIKEQFEGDKVMLVKLTKFQNELVERFSSV